MIFVQWSIWAICDVSDKKVLWNSGNNFAKSLPIFKHFSVLDRGWNYQPEMYKKFPPQLNRVSTLPCEMQNVWKWHKLCTSCYKTSQNLLKTSSLDQHISSQMRVPLVIVAGEVLYLSEWQRHPQCSHTLSGFSVSGAATIRVYMTTSNSPYLKLVAYIICGNMSSLFTSCVFKMSMNWRSVCWSFGTTWNLLLTVQ